MQHGHCLQVKMDIGRAQHSRPSMLPSPAMAPLAASPALDQVCDINDLNVMLRWFLDAAFAPYVGTVHYLGGISQHFASAAIV